MDKSYASNGVARFDLGFSLAQEQGRTLEFLAETIRSEILAREILSKTINESFQHIDENFAKIFRELEKQEKKGIALEREVQELSRLLHNCIQEVRNQGTLFNGINQKINEQVGHLSEQVGRLLAELSENRKQDDLQDTRLDGVHSIAYAAKKEAEEAKEHYRKVLSQAAMAFGGRVFALSVFMMLYQLGAYLGWWPSISQPVLGK